MASPNPYAMDPNLMLGFSNLSKALLGSAQDDASTARANLYDEQAATDLALREHKANEILANILLKEAQTSTSGQQGRLYGLQADGQNIENKDSQIRLNAFADVSKDPAVIARTLEMLGVESGVSGSSLVRSMLNLSSNSEQVQKALSGIGKDADTGIARKIQLDPSSTEQDILNAMAITNPTTYGSMTNNILDNKTSKFNNAADNRQSGLNNAADNKQSGLNNAADNKQSGLNNAATNRQSGVNNILDNKTSKFNNAADNKQSGLNNAADNKQSGLNNAATNRQSGVNNAATNSTKLGIAKLKEEVGLEAYTEFLEQYAITVNKYGSKMQELPSAAMGWIEKTAMQALRDDMIADPDIIYGDAFNQNVVPMVAAGHMKVTYGRNFLFPRFVFDMHLQDGNRTQLLISAEEMGYSAQQVENLGKEFDAAKG